VKFKLPKKTQGNGPWAIASFIAIPLFFSSLMASTLALEKPYVIQWTGCKNGICTTWHQPTSGTEARIWLTALVPPLILIVIGWICTRLPFGWYIACAAGIVMGMAVVHKTETWAAHHTSRFPNGVDLIPASNSASNQYDPGEWEKIARETALSLSHWTIGVALAAIVTMALVTAKRRYFGRGPYIEPIGTGAHGVDTTEAPASVSVE
jgi:hypothetical protein